LETCYREKFGIPRQPGLVEGAWSRLALPNNDTYREAVYGLESFSHVWLTFVFHEVADRGWKARVRPPRLGGDQSIGVFASRSPFRPNSIGLSVVTFKSIKTRGDQLVLNFGASDLVSGTPILDIKPYLPEVDSIPEATSGWLPEWPKLKVEWSIDAEQVLKLLLTSRPHLKALITSTLSQDPRPAYRRGKDEGDRVYGMTLDGFDVGFKVDGDVSTVMSLRRCDPS
jgi:tRNA-Thr(GGU) m(6)t(6)A37 methyltransferase TsaA